MDTTHTDGRGPTAGTASFTEAIDRRTGSIRASGRLDGRAADMLSGTVDVLRRGGCSRIVLDLGGVQDADAGEAAVRVLARRVAADGGSVALLNWPGPVTAAGPTSPTARR